SYNTSLHDNNEFRWNTTPPRIPLFIKQKMDINSIYYQFGVGLKYNVSKLIDIEARTMYIISGDDEFDGGGNAGPADYDPASKVSKYNMISKRRSDNAWTVNLGVSFKLGKHLTHLAWHDPLQETYSRIHTLENTNVDFVVCEKGDQDNDGVCDDWDRQLDTPAGARVDGAGVALDMDLDGVIDLYDKCVTVPGPVENHGCPLSNNNSSMGLVTDESRILKGIEFDLDSDRILPSNTPILSQAINYINTSSGSFKVIGGTDTRGTEQYNQGLSERRAKNVKEYLIQNGADGNKLEAIGRGETNLLYPECEPAEKCPEWKNRANRRVYFEAK
ncbi:MAG: flagellar motor protein MotB, partial [Chryseobacterium sp.]